MNTLINQDSQELSITLKEITDLISVEHNKAMKQIEKLAKESSFGTVEKTTTVYNDKGQTIPTYILNKKQAIAAGAKLNNSLLMKVIDRLEELEEKPKHDLLQNMLIYKEKLTALNDAQQATMDVVQQHDNRLNQIEQNRRLDTWQERGLQDAKNRKVYQYAQDDKKLANVLHRKVWSLFKKKFNLPRYSELRAIQYESGLEYINSLTLADMVA